MPARLDSTPPRRSSRAEIQVAIDLINRLPAPYGLVRDGVAPDHQAIKSVARVYAKMLARDEVRYFGNVTLGEDVSVDDLRTRYDQIVYAVGAQSDRRLGIPGEDLGGSHAAFHFVGWYNASPPTSATRSSTWTASMWW